MLLRRKESDLWVIWINLCSIVFYGYWSFDHLLLFLFSITINYLISAPIKGKSKVALAFGIIFNLTLLSFYKYTNFLIDNINTITSHDYEWINIVLPIGISFFTFQQIAFLVDLYYGKAKLVTFNRYFFFVSFFPQLIAGPIVHHSDIFPQFSKKIRVPKHLAIGFSVFCIGLFKKVIIADSLAMTANNVFTFAESGGNPTFIEAWFGALAYTLQIYFDFSAYSDMAIGLAYMFGIRLPHNFSSPYKAISIIDFWRKWHITLSRFLKDYLYIPLGGNRHGTIKRYLNVMITMLIGGLWHGASWNFVLWGGLHGLFLVINQSFQKIIKLQIPWFISWSMTMVSITFAWILFRAADIPSVISMWKGMLFINGIKTPQGLSIPGIESGALINGVNIYSGLEIIIFALICFLSPNVSEIFSRYNVALIEGGYSHTKSKNKYLLWRPTFVWAMLILMLFICSLLKLGDPSDFLYFQF
tara:strand:- start:3014 stop:4429 length:1416 start_codon:yes stop_codon:yes gene_type:complete